MTDRLPAPRLTRVYRLEAALGDPLDIGALLYVQSRGVRHVFRTSTQIETASRDLDWLNKGVFVSVAGRRPGGVVYETYLVA